MAPSIYVDITNTYTTRAGTGIQRVVRELSRRLARALPEIDFIHFDKEKEGYFKLASIDTSLSAGTKPGTPGKKLFFSDLKAGDIFIEIDAAWGDPLDRRSLLARLKASGVIIICMHYDAVPVLFPDFSHPNTVFRYTGYLAAHLDFADYFICISNTVKADLENLSLEITRRKVTAFTLPLGADFEKPYIPAGAPPDIPEKRLTGKKFLLAVGTLEPRKNHEMLLSAFDLIDKKHPLNLVIVGKQGWNIDGLAREIKDRPDFGKRVFWLENASDAQLLHLYETAFICINVAHYEGYGLPVIESLDHDCVTICSKGGALEEVAGGACRILADNTAACLAKDVTALYDDPPLYLKYKNLAQKFCPTTWDDSSKKFLDILDQIRYAPNFNWGFIPQQAVYISIDPSHLSLSTQSVVRNIKFIKKLVLLTADRCKEEMAAVLEETGLEYTILTDEEIYDRYQVNHDEFYDHQRRNTFLRKALFQDKAIDANFLSFDDDYLVQEKIGIDFFMEDECHFGFYFIKDAAHWLGSPGRPTSYDAGILRTGAMLTSCGYDHRIFSSHMPQIINKKMAALVYDRMVNSDADAMCEWSLYFNILSHLHPSHCLFKNYATLSWPCNPTDWIPAKHPDNCFFENYYEWNYTAGGRFYGMPIMGALSRKIALWEKAFKGQYNQRKLNRQQFDCDYPKVTLLDNCMELGFGAWDVLEDELLRLKIENRTKTLEDAQLRVNVLNGPKSVSRTQVDALVTRWVPIKTINEAPGVVLVLSFYDKKTNRRIDRKTIDINFVTVVKDNKNDNKINDNRNDNKNDKAPGYIMTEKQMAKQKITQQELMAQLSTIDGDELFIKEAYRLMLDRKPGLEELEFALLKLDMGVSRKYFIINMLRSGERTQSAKGRVKLTWLENTTTFLWKKSHDIYSGLRTIQNFSRAIFMRHQSFDRLFFDVQKNLSVHDQKLTNIQNQLEQIKTNVLFFQHQEAQAQQRRLDQFFFDVRQELRLSQDDTKLKKLETLSKHSIAPYYIALEESYRGSRDAILERYEPYLDLIKPLLPQTREIKAADLGCGRGEWLQIVSRFCPGATGLDFNSAMVAECRKHGLEASQGDLIQWIRQQADQSCDLITAFHVIEHLPFQLFNELISQIYRVLTPDGILMLETPNPANLHVATHMFYRDPTHKNPIPKELTEHLLNYNGFTDIKTHPMHPFPKQMHLPEDSEVARRFNLMVYGAQDYLVIAKKPSDKK